MEVSEPERGVMHATAFLLTFGTTLHRVLRFRVDTANSYTTKTAVLDELIYN